MDDVFAVLNALRDYGPSALTGVRVGIDLYKGIAASLKEKFRHTSSAVEAKAIANASDVAHRIGRKIDALIEGGEVSEQQAQAAMDRPDFAKLLERVVLDASESSSEVKHEQLATLVAAALKGQPESPEVVMSRIACATIPNLTVAQLKLLGLVFFVRHVTPNDPVDAGTEVREARFDARVAQFAMLFDGVVPTWPDAAQLQAFGVLEVFSISSGGGIAITRFPAQVITYAQHAFGKASGPGLLRVQQWMIGANGAQRLDSVTLTPLGLLIGSTMFTQLSGVPALVELGMSTENDASVRL